MVAVSEEELGTLLDSPVSTNRRRSTVPSNYNNNSEGSESSMSLGLGGGSGSQRGDSSERLDESNGSIELGASYSRSLSGSQRSLLLDESESSHLSLKDEKEGNNSLSSTLLDDSEGEMDIPVLAEAKSSDDSDDQTQMEGENADAQELMKDHLDLMLEIVMRIREDEEFASSIYDNCPRLQYLLDQHPDLRPVFEDPHLVQINFEKVYRDAGGVLPEDKPSKIKIILAAIVNHPLFKVLKFLILIKKIVNCILGGGFSFVRGVIKGCIGGLCCESAVDMADLAGDGGGAGEGGPGGPSGEGGAEGGDGEGGEGDNDHEGSPENQANREALNRAADHMEDPEVQERMQEILELDDEDALADAIEDDPELKALRDSNPLCAELMSDPDTMKILVDPDNLRALGECPDLIEQDFASPDWQPPDIESGSPEGATADGVADGVDTPEGTTTGGGATSDAMSGRLETVAEADFEGDFEEGHDSFGVSQDLEIGDDDLAEPEGDVDGEGEGEEGEEEEEEEGPEYELGDEEMESDKKASGANKGQQKQQQNKKSQNNDKNGGGGESGRGAFISSAATGLRDMLAAELIGVTVSELTGQDDLIPMDDAVDEGADAAETTADNVDSAAQTAAGAGDVLMSDDVAGNLEDGMDEIEDTHDEKAEQDADKQDQRRAAAGAGAAGGVAVAGGGGDGNHRSRDIESGHGDDEDTAEEVPPTEGEGGEEKKKKSRLGFVGNWAGAVATAGKEYLATAVLGDDLGEMLVERIEEDDDSSDEEGEEGKKGEGEEGQDEKPKRKGLFRRKKA